ncbi:hypothetical protein NQD34_009450 [Periophthalmus magnuspinnatus]|nr:hypothetical protein NQD34_009450 [Periophthalmus magnuspinnatus]
MTAEYFHGSPVASQQKGWVVVNTNRNVNDSRDLSPSKTGSKLLFNEAIPACTSNRATRVDLPVSIVIEKLMPLPEEHTFEDSSKSSISFTVLSEEQLNAAVKLAKRDLRRRRLDSLNRSSPKHMQKSSLLETSDVELLQELGTTPSKIKLMASSPKETKPRGRLVGHSSHKSPTTQGPTKQHGLPERNHLVHEILRLQHELQICIQKAVELASREQKVGEPLEPDEQSKLDIRKQKQAARSTSIIYALQHQVKEVQENLEKGHYQSTKSTSLKRLAAAHRGALRALHVFIQHLSNTTHCTNLPNFKDLGQLIRQLCLCSTKAELNEGSAVPQSAHGILQMLEMLDSALCKQHLLRKMQVQACPPPRETHHSTSIKTSRGANAFIHQTSSKPVKAVKNVKGKKKAPRKPKAVSQVLTHRGDLLRVGVEKLAQQREQENKAEGHSRKTTYNKYNQVHNTNFLQPTVSSRLRENQLPTKEQAVPWIPTSPHSPPRRRSRQPKTRPEPRCLFSPEKSHPSTARSRFKAEPSLNLEKKQQAQEEAMRRVWLDKMTMQRLKKLQQLSEEETQRLQLLRSKVISPTRWAEGEQKATENVQHLLDQAQQFGDSSSRTVLSLNNRLNEHVAHGSAESADQLSEALLEDLLEDTARAAWALQTDGQLEGRAQRRMQTSTLENMLVRMEEIQRDQEEVRRRVTSIIYSDPLNWDKPKDPDKSPGSTPSSPQPIRLTQPELTQGPITDIILAKPLETGAFIEARSPEDEGSQVRRSAMFPAAVQRGRGAILSVPGHTLRNIRQYREDYEAYRSAVGHGSTRGVTPWAIADSLAEELLAEAVTEVAAEFQDVVEEYAEAVFTSEFLQPVQSPAPPVQEIT